MSALIPASPRHPCGRNGSQDAAVSVLLGLLAFAALVLLMPRSVGLFDEGIILSDAMRVLAGEIVHRDFYSNYGPAQYYVVAAVFKLTDNSFLAARLYDIACKALICGLLFYIPRAMVGWPMALLVATVSGLWFVALGSFPLYPIYPCMVLGLVATYLMTRSSDRQGSLWAASAAGACAGATALFRYEVGFFLLAANLLGAAILIWLGNGAAGAFRRWGTVVIAYGLGTAVVFVPVAAAFLLAAPLGGFWHDIIVFSTTHYGSERGLPFPAPRHAAAFGAVLFAPVMALLGLVEAGRISWTGARCAATAADVLARALLVLFSLCALFFALKGVVRVSPLHMLLAIVPALVVAAILAQRWLSSGLKLARAGAAIVVLLAIGPPALSALGELRNDERRPDTLLAGLLAERAGQVEAPPCRTTARSTVATYGPDYARVANYIARRTLPGDRIFVALDRHDKIFNNAVALYFATGRLPGTHWHQFDPGLQTRADIQAAIIADLEANRVLWVVRDGSIENPNEPNGSSKSSGVRILDEYLDTKYRPVASSGRIAAWLLKGVDSNTLGHLATCEANSAK